MTARLIQTSRFESILDLVRLRTGLNFSASQRPAAESQILAAMADANIAAPDGFLRHIESDDDAFQSLIEGLTVRETYFFREREQFEMLRRLVLPSLRNNLGSDDIVRVWSAGCASGEEAYSLAILLEQEAMAGRASIVGTDISRRALRHARRACYSGWSFRENAPDLTETYFDRCGAMFTLMDRFRARVRFEPLNLRSAQDPDDFLGGGFNLILCRNVLFYFDPDSVACVARRLFGSLNDGGWLVIGPSDPPLWLHAPFETVVTPAGVLYRRPCDAVAGAVRLIDRRESAHGSQTGRRCHAIGVINQSPWGAGGERTASSPTEVAGAAMGGSPQAVPQGGPLQLRPWTAMASRYDTQPSNPIADEDATAGGDVLSSAFHYSQAILLMSKGRYDQAAALLRRAIYLDHSMAVAHFALGSILHKRGSIAGAQRSYRNVLAACDRRRTDEIVPFSDGEQSGRMAEAVRAQLAFLCATAGSQP